MSTSNTPQDFWNYVDKTTNPVGCWEWTGTLTRDGYGMFHVEGKRYRAHRYIFGSTSNLIRHTCDNRKCVNTAHLIVGSNKDNSQDMVLRNRQAKGIKAGNSKLSETDVLAIRASLELASKVAKFYGIHEDTVRQIRARRTWRHI
jgi:hypothetical protein